RGPRRTEVPVVVIEDRRLRIGQARLCFAAIVGREDVGEVVEAVHVGQGAPAGCPAWLAPRAARCQRASRARLVDPQVAVLDEQQPAWEITRLRALAPGSEE